MTGGAEAFSNVYVILSLRRIRNFERATRSWIDPSVALPCAKRACERSAWVPPSPRKMSAARAVQGFFMAAGGSWDAWIPQDDMQRKHRIQAAKLTARASGGSDSSRSGRGIQRLWSPTLPSISSRRMSTWPAWRAVSSSMWMSTQRSDTASPNHAVPVASRSSSSMTRSEAERARL
jgi:hypothetical protein